MASNTSSSRNTSGNKNIDHPLNDSFVSDSFLTPAERKKLNQRGIPLEKALKMGVLEQMRAEQNSSQNMKLDETAAHQQLTHGTSEEVVKNTANDERVRRFQQANAQNREKSQITQRVSTKPKKKGTMVGKVMKLTFAGAGAGMFGLSIWG